MDTFAPPIDPTVQSSATFTANVLQAGFGDGYEQTASAGLNPITGVYSVSWDLLSSSDLATLENFFVTEGGYRAFAYTFPGETTPRRFKCKTWTRTYTGALFALKAEFREVFDIGTIGSAIQSGAGLSFGRGGTLPVLTAIRGGAAAAAGTSTATGGRIDQSVATSAGTSVVAAGSNGTALLDGQPTGLLLAVTYTEAGIITQLGSSAGTSTATAVGDDSVGKPTGLLIGITNA